MNVLRMLIPAPREMTMTGGEVLAASAAPKTEVVKSIPPEGYELSITTNGVTIRHSDDAGLFYAKMTLAQLRTRTGQSPSLPCLEIKDAPAFRWRGVHLGETQRLFGKRTIKRMLDLMSRYKFNVFHWHFTDDRGWRIDFPEYPNLARKSDPPGLCSNEQALFYSKEDVREILAYAKARHITVVPEIEFPGHFLCALCAYPELSCDPNDILKHGRQPLSRGVLNSVMCVGNPDAIRFVEKVLDYVCELFPSEVIHIGGDECPRRAWTKCAKCQAFIKEKGLKGVEDIQPWLTRHFVEYLAKKGRRTIGWDEIFVDSKNQNAKGDAFTSMLPKTTMGMCWRNHGAGALAANKGYEIVRCPTSHCYFDYRQGLPEDPYIYIGGMLPLARVYQFDPFVGVAPEARKNVVGGQCCNWTSHTWNRYDMEWKLWPRGFAMAEVLWTYPDPAKRDFKEFASRAAEYRRRLIRSHVNCAPLK